MSRNRLLAQVHLAKKFLALEDESYRSLLTRVTGQSSAGDLTEAQLREVVSEFKRLGWQEARQYPVARAPEVRKIFAIWNSLRGVLNCRGSRAGLRAFVERQVGVSDPNFLNGAQARQVVEALKSIQKRHGIVWEGNR